MKQILLLFTFLVATLNIAYSQVEYSASEYKSYAGKIEKSNKTIEDPKKKDLSKTWLERAKLLQEIGDYNTQFLRSNNMSLLEIKAMFKNPKEIKKTTIKEGTNDKIIDQYVYDYFTLNIEGDKLRSWQETSPIFPNALDEAVKCYNKALELDVDGKQTKKIVESLKTITPVFQKVALNYYSLKDYENSYHSFKSIMDINDMKQVNVKDTVIMYYTGVFASESDHKDEAILYLSRAIDLNYWQKEPDIFVFLSKMYLAKKDSTGALTALKSGFSKSPGNINILNELINYYLVRGDSKPALIYLSQAISKDPSNRSYYFAKGVLYDKIDSLGDAIESYKKAIQVDTSYFDAYFNLGVVYYNHAVKLLEKANDEQDNNKYLEMKTIADGEFKKCIPYMEKCHFINPKDKPCLESLKNIYYRLKMNDQLDRIKKLLEALN